LCARRLSLVCVDALSPLAIELVLIHYSGTKFLIITDPLHQNVDALQKKVYDLYSNYVMKNPFHTPEMPIRSDQFDVGLSKLISEA
jgi:hypothetical protein